MSFSCVPPVVAYRRLEIYARAAPGHRGAFSPLDTNGRPKRRCVLCRLIHILFHPSQRSDFFFFLIFRFSERAQEQWFEVDRNGISYSGADRSSATA